MGGLERRCPLPGSVRESGVPPQNENKNKEKRAIAGHVERAFHSIFNTSILETEYIYIYNSNHVIIADREGRAFEYVDMRIHDDWA